MTPEVVFANPASHDADLLALLVREGTAASRSQTVPDRTIRFDVSPRNLNVGR